jgi:hypothetical protein
MLILLSGNWPKAGDTMFTHRLSSQHINKYSGHAVGLQEIYISMRVACAPRKKIVLFSHAY